MAITEQFSFTRTLVGDGVTTSYVVDLTEDIQKINCIRKVPASIFSVQGVTLSSSSLSGQQVTLNFSAALTNATSYGVTIYLDF